MPDARAQFRNPANDTDHAYMGGTAVTCGQHPTLPKRHRWGEWQRVEFKTGAVAWERTCKTCALVSDLQWTKPRGAVV